MLHIIIWLSVLLAYSPINTWASTNQISGTVVDVDGSYLPGVNVVIKKVDGTATGSFTDENGLFSIADVSAGTYTIQLSHIGYSTLHKQINVTKNVNIMQNFILHPTLFMLTQNVVSASKKEEKILYAPASTFLLTTDEVRKKSFLNLTDHIQDIPGVDFGNTRVQQHLSFGSAYSNR